MPARVAIGAQRHRDARQQHRQETAEQQKALGAFQGAVDGFVGVANAAPAIVGCQFLFDGVLHRRQVAVVASQRQPIADAAAGLDDAGGGYVFRTHQQTRCELEEVAAAIRFAGEHRRDDEIGVANGHAVADFDAKRRQQPRIQPRFAGPRHGIGDFAGREGFLRDAQYAP